MTDVPIEQDRRIATAQRLDQIGDDLATMRTELRAFMTAQAATNAAQAAINSDFREHAAKSSALERVHDDLYQQSHQVDIDHAARIRAVEDWRIEMRTLGTILRATFGVSVIGAVLALVSLLNMIVTFGK